MWALKAALVLSCTFLAGCVASPPAPLNLFPADDAGQAPVTWPAPPEVPRYRYAGMLLGEENYRTTGDQVEARGRRFLRWLVGLDHADNPRGLVRPQSGHVDGRGRVLVTDVGLGAVVVFAPDGLQIWNRADGGSDFIAPIGVVAATGDEIWVADAGLGRVVRLSADGIPLGNVGEGELVRPTGLAFDTVQQRLYVADSAAHRIVVFDAAGNLIEQLGTRGVEPGTFNGPTHLQFAAGRLYVSDTLNARVQVLAPDGSVERVIGKRGLFVGNLNRPKGLTVDGDGNVYVVESYFDHLLVFSASGELLLPIGGTGTRIGQFFLPAGAWTDDQGRVYVADMFNARIVMFQYLGD